jgi:hypothetical protein
MDKERERGKEKEKEDEGKMQLSIEERIVVEVRGGRIIRV